MFFNIFQLYLCYDEPKSHVKEKSRVEKRLDREACKLKPKNDKETLQGMSLDKSEPA